MGLLVLAVSVPILAFFLKESPEGMGLPPDGSIAVRQAPEKQHIEGLAWRDARRDQTFWLMVSAISLVGASVHGCVLHLAPMLSDQGVSPQRVASAISFLGIAILIGRVGSGYLLDRFFAPRVAMCLFGGAATPSLKT
jgi:predicted MFS family arabinose efflux permease